MIGINMDKAVEEIPESVQKDIFNQKQYRDYFLDTNIPLSVLMSGNNISCVFDSGVYTFEITNREYCFSLRFTIHLHIVENDHDRFREVLIKYIDRMDKVLNIRMNEYKNLPNKQRKELAKMWHEIEKKNGDYILKYYEYREGLIN